MTRQGKSAEWTRVHPVTPLVRGWAMVAAVLFFAGRWAAEDLRETRDQVSHSGPWLLVAVLVMVLALFSYATVAWIMTGYCVDAESVRFRSGIVFRQHRHVRLDRLQAIDVGQPLLARIFGLAELSIEVAGGAGSGVRLGYVKLGEAHQLRAELLELASGYQHVVSASTDGVAPRIGVAKPSGRVARQAVRVPTGRFIGSVCLSGSFMVTVVALVVLGGVAAGTRQWALIFAALPALFGFGTVVWVRVTQHFGFQSAVSPEGILLHRGLFNTRTQTIPVGRIQAIELSQPWWWRRLGWWKATSNIAGYVGGDGEDESSPVLLPVGDARDAQITVWLILPDLGVDDPAVLLERAMVDAGVPPGFEGLPRRAWLFSPMAWRRTGVMATGEAVLIRRGWLVRRVTIIPHGQVQSLALRQGIVQRWLRLATVDIHSTPGPLRPRIAHLADTDAQRWWIHQRYRAHVASMSGVSTKQDDPKGKEC